MGNCKPHCKHLLERRQPKGTSKNSLQADDAAYEGEIAEIKKMRAAAEAHCTGCQAAAKRFSSILGIPEVKP